MQVYSGITYPHYAKVRAYSKELVKEPDDPQSLQEKADLLKLGGLLMAKDRTLIGILIGGGIVRDFLRRPGDGLDMGRVDFAARGREFNAQQEAANVPRPVDAELLGRLAQRYGSAWSTVLDDRHHRFSLSTAVASAVLASLTITFMLIALASLLRVGRLPRPPGHLAAHLFAYGLWQSALIWQSHAFRDEAYRYSILSGGPGLQALAPVLLLCALAQFVPRIRGSATVVALALAIGASLFGIGGLATGLYIAVIALALVPRISRRLTAMSWLPYMGVVVLPLLLGANFAYLAIFSSLIAAGLITALLLVAALGAWPPRAPGQAVATGTAFALAIAYVACVGWDMRDNERAGSLVQKWLTEADRLRAVVRD